MSQEPQPDEHTVRKLFLDQRREDLDEWTLTDKLLAVIAVGIGLAIAIIAFCGYLFEWKWTGITKPAPQTFWDWLGLLIVPVVLALGGYLFKFAASNGRAALNVVLEKILFSREVQVSFDTNLFS